VFVTASAPVAAGAFGWPVAGTVPTPSHSHHNFDIVPLFCYIFHQQAMLRTEQWTQASTYLKPEPQEGQLT